jgi:hypothetical protein
MSEWVSDLLVSQNSCGRDFTLRTLCHRLGISLKFVRSAFFSSQLVDASLQLVDASLQLLDASLQLLDASLQLLDASLQLRISPVLVASLDSRFVFPFCQFREPICKLHGTAGRSNIFMMMMMMMMMMMIMMMMIMSPFVHLGLWAPSSGVRDVFRINRIRFSHNSSLKSSFIGNVWLQFKEDAQLFENMCSKKAYLDVLPKSPKKTLSSKGRKAEPPPPAHNGE